MKKYIIYLFVLLMITQSCNSDDNSDECPDNADCIFVGLQKLSIQFISEQDTTDIFFAEGEMDLQIIFSLIDQLSVVDLEQEQLVEININVDGENVFFKPAIHLEGANTFEFTLENLIDVQLGFDREVDQDSNVMFTNFTITGAEIINDGIDANGVTNIRLVVNDI